jgi:hypothetical protein
MAVNRSTDDSHAEQVLAVVGRLLVILEIAINLEGIVEIISMFLDL